MGNAPLSNGTTPGEPRIQHPRTELAATRQRAKRRRASSKSSWSRDIVEWTIADLSHRKDVRRFRTSVEDDAQADESERSSQRGICHHQLSSRRC
eukprot:3274005-Prymnesium_polylepis.1